MGRGTHKKVNIGVIFLIDFRQKLTSKPGIKLTALCYTYYARLEYPETPRSRHIGGLKIFERCL